MKKLFASVALTAMMALTGSAFAQAPTPQSPSMAPPMMQLSSKDSMRAKWAFYNADAREVKRFKAKGFTETEFKAIANIAYNAGVPTEYVARQVQEVGHPLNFVAAWLGVPTDTLDDDFPGWNMGPGMTTVNGTPMASSTSTMSTTASSSMASGTVVDVAMSDPQFSTLVAALKAAGLVDTLKGAGPFTIFAPTNEAFAKLPAGALENLLKPENKDQLVSILTYHVVPGKIKASDVMAMSNPSMPTAVSGKQLNVKTTAPVMVNNANVIRTDIEASNGVIHAIDTVLMP